MKDIFEVITSDFAGYCTREVNTQKRTCLNLKNRKITDPVLQELMPFKLKKIQVININKC